MRSLVLRAGAGAMAASVLLPWGSLLQLRYPDGQLAWFDLRGSWLVAGIGVLVGVLSTKWSLPARAATVVLAAIGVVESLPAAYMLLAANAADYSRHVRVGPGAPICLAGALVALGAALWPERRPAATSALASGTS